MRSLLAAALALTVLLGRAPAEAHDPSAYGGLFRSRTMGGTWLNADVGLFLRAALTLAVDPRDPTRLLLGTDSGLLRSTNGGRSWSPEAPGLVVGAVLALATAADGTTTIAAAPSGVFRHAEGAGWTRADAPDEAVPARSLAFGATFEGGTGAGRVYLLGRSRLYRSEDGGRSFAVLGSGLVDGAAITGLAVVTAPAETLLATTEGGLAGSRDGGETWRPLAVPAAPALDTVVPDPAVPGRVWAAAGDRLFVSDDLARTWRMVGRPLPEAGTNVRGIAADPAATTLVVTTQRGLFRSADGGASWYLAEDNLPVHLEAGPLARDPSDARTLYAMFSLVPSAEIWRAAIEGSNLLARSDPVSLVGGLAMLILLLVAGALLVRWLVQVRSAPASRQGSHS